MTAHDQLIHARHEDPLRVPARTDAKQRPRQRRQQPALSAAAPQ